MLTKKKVLFVAFEGLPFVKTGGLADVVYALPQALNKDKYEVRVVLPLLKQIKEKWMDKLYYLDHIEVDSGCIKEGANIYNLFYDGVEYQFIENDTFFSRDGVYGYSDDACRYSFYCIAVIEMMIKLNYYPNIVHTHDYHTAPISALCKLRFNQNKNIARIRHVFTIHNLVYQGMYDKHVLFDFLGFDYKWYGLGILKYNDACNFMKIGIECADIITTVSDTYAKEIQTKEGGAGLDGLLSYKKEDLYGIVNGIDVASFDPKSDDIAMNYDLKSFQKAKLHNKYALQRLLGLKEDSKTLLVGMVSRLTFQKGVDLIEKIYPNILQENVQLAILGTGEERYENSFKTMEERYKGQAVYYCGYNEKLAHQFYAGLDMLVMPSLFEPCGISQLIAMHYGTLPLVRETGGLKDTVLPYNEYTKEGRGFSFGPYNEYDLLKVFNYAYDTFNNNKDDWKMLIKNAMSYDVSFVSSAKKYEEIYKKLVGDVYEEI